jgi:hypothetical protein
LSGSLASSCEVSRRTLRITNPERADFPSGRSADELCVTDLADVIWAVQMNTVVPSLEHPGPPTWSTPTSGASIWTQPRHRVRAGPAGGGGGTGGARRSGTVARVKSPGSASGTSSQRSGGGHHRLGYALHRVGDVHAGIDDAAFSLEPLLD